MEVNSVAPADVVPHNRADELQVANPRPEPVEVDGLVTLSSGHLLNFLRLTFHNQGSVLKSGSLHTIKVSRFFDCVLRSRVAHLMVSLFLCSSVSKARGKSGTLEGHRIISKKPFKDPRHGQVFY